MVAFGATLGVRVMLGSATSTLLAEECLWPPNRTHGQLCRVTSAITYNEHHNCYLPCEEIQGKQLCRGSYHSKRTVFDTGSIYKEPPYKCHKKRQFEYEGQIHDEDCSSPEEIFKWEFLYTPFNIAHVSIEELFKHLESHWNIWRFLHILEKQPEETLTTHRALTNGNHPTISGADPCVKQGHLGHILSPGKGSPWDAMQYIHNTKMTDVFPNIWIALNYPDSCSCQ